MKDDRLYAKLTLEFADSPKIMPLSDAAFRCLVEATLYSRRMLTDGFLSGPMALKKWGPEVLSELAGNDPENPSLVTVDGGYQIHDYSKHQDTAAEVEARRSRNAENGRRGGLARSKRLASDSLSENVAKPKRDSSETQAETETETTKSEARKRATQVPAGFSITAEMRSWAADHVPLVDIDRKLSEFVDYWRGRGDVRKDWEATWRNGMRKQQEFAEKDKAKVDAPAWEKLRRLDDRK